MSDAAQGPDWWQASDGKWYPPAGGGTSGAAGSGAPASGGGGALSSLPLPGVSSTLLSLLAWAALLLGVIDAFWSAFIANGPDDFVDKVSLGLSTIGGWSVVFAILLVGAVVARGNEA